MKDSKRQCMSKSFSALGVTFDLSSSKLKKIVVCNKPSRIEQVCQEVDGILVEGRFTIAAAASLRGKLQFAESQTFSRAVSLHMRECHSRAAGHSSGTDINPAMKRELVWAKEFISNSPPRILHAGMSGCRAVIFTDAFLDDQSRLAGVGMVMYKLSGGKVVDRLFFSEAVPGQVLARLQIDTPKVIAALELMLLKRSWYVKA